MDQFQSYTPRHRDSQRTASVGPGAPGFEIQAVSPDQPPLPHDWHPIAELALTALTAQIGDYALPIRLPIAELAHVAPSVRRRVRTTTL